MDTGIPVDMIAKMSSNYDVAILVSGDADFLPVVGYLKDNPQVRLSILSGQGRSPVYTISLAIFER